MARNGSGTYAVPNSFTPATTISSAAVNTNFSDAGDEITNSVAADGQTTITGALKGANGSAATPSYGFAADTNTGMYRKGADSLGFATAGSERFYIDSSGNLVIPTGDLTLTAGALTPGGALTLINDGLHLLDTDASHDLIVSPGSDLTEDRTLSLVTGDADRSLTISGDTTLGGGSHSGTNTGDEAAASATVAGVVELATVAEAETGTDTARAVTPAGVLASIRANAITPDTAQATTSGTSFDFTGIPAGVNQITVMFDQVSLSGSDGLLVQIGDSGGLETTGYESVSGNRSTEANSTSGFRTFSAASVNGIMTLARITGNVWVSSHSIMPGGVGNPQSGGGRKALSAELDRVRLTRTGSDTFDAGQVNILYE